ncbi:MAG: hypothetical protein IPO21_04495 [Bacteroidales bacterium]|nr:hypothetical protein [Bacteroidales bacterium]
MHLLLVGMLALSVSLFTSCGEEEVDPEAPKLNWTNYDGSDKSVLVGEAVSFEFEIEKVTNDIKSVEVYYTVGSGDDFYLCNTADSSSAPKDGDKIKVSKTFTGVGVYPFVFVVTDKEDLKFTDTVNVTVEAAFN